MIEIFPHEEKLGLADSIRANNSVAFIAQLTSQVEAKPALAFISALAEQHKQIDLHYLQTILVTSGGNKNDDVFEKQEMWLARHSAKDKPFNHEHDCTDIIGHITGTEFVDENKQVVAEYTDDLGKCHIITSAVIYKLLPDEQWRHRIAGMIEEIDRGEWCVSMEALFDAFDYAVFDGDDSYRVVARTKENSYMTACLRAYGGNGIFGGQKIGRVLRNIVFSGKGLVRNPANPESVILTDAETDESVASDSIDTTKGTEYMKTNDVLESEVAELKATLATLTKERDEAVAGLAVIAELKTTVAELTEKLTATEATKAEIATAHAESAKAYDALKLELDTFKATVVKASRISQFEKIGYPTDEATAHVETFAELNDDLFAKVVAGFKPFGKEKEDEKKDEKKAKADETVDSDETDTAEANADVSLETVVVSDEPDLATASDKTDPNTQIQEIGDYIGSVFLGRGKRNKK